MLLELTNLQFLEQDLLVVLLHLLSELGDPCSVLVAALPSESRSWLLDQRRLLVLPTNHHEWGCGAGLLALTTFCGLWAACLLCLAHLALELADLFLDLDLLFLLLRDLCAELLMLELD